MKTKYCDAVGCEAEARHTVPVSLSVTEQETRNYCESCAGPYTVGCQHGTLRTQSEVEDMMRVAEDTKKHFAYHKDQGAWHWVCRDEQDNLDAYHGPFATFIAALEDAVEPYLKGK